MLSDEEKKAIERIDYIQDFIIENGQYNADVNDMQYFSKVLNIVEKQSKEIEELKDTRSIFNMGRRSYKNEIEDKIKAKIGKRMQKNNNIIHNAKLKYGKDYVYYDDVQEAKEENRICKEVLQSLYNGRIHKYEVVNDNYLVETKTGMPFDFRSHLMLGKVSENRIDLLEVGDLVLYKCINLSGNSADKLHLDIIKHEVDLQDYKNRFNDNFWKLVGFITKEELNKVINNLEDYKNVIKHIKSH